MIDPDQPPTADRLTALLDHGDDEEAVAFLNRLGAADADARKRVLGAARDAVDERPSRFEGLAPPLASFLTDADRAVRLTTAKLFVALARSAPAVALPAVEALAERLADDGEFYYVRARCAEALGYVGRDYPDAVNDPDILADFRVGLSFDEPEVKRKLAKALEYVALGDPDRLRHQVPAIAEHLDDENDLVRYHLCTALAAIGCVHPDRLAAARDGLTDRLLDERETTYVRGRAAEALGLMGRGDDDPPSPPDDIDGDDEDAARFAALRLEFLRTGRTGNPGDEGREVGTPDSLRDSTETAVESMTSANGEACPHCGLELPVDGPPTCPRCGSPH